MKNLNGQFGSNNYHMKADSDHCGNIIADKWADGITLVGIAFLVDKDPLPRTGLEDMLNVGTSIIHTRCNEVAFL